MLEHDYEKEFEKIENTCSENNLEFDLYKTRFPIRAIIKPDEQARNQMMMDLGDGIDNFKSGQIIFVFSDELTMQIINDFTIEDSLLNKIKNQVKKLHYLYLQMYFKRQSEWDELLKNKEGEIRND